jgi:hypothetical protein
MPKLSLYRPNKQNDYRFMDRTISEQMTVGGTDLYVHKYLGPTDQGPSADYTQPEYATESPTNIQDLLFLENRDRTYDTSIYRLRGHYNVQNLDFDLSQFGLFLNNDIIFITVHYNDMIDLVGRKLMVGDVIELPHLLDYNPLDETIPVALKRFMQITDSNYASEGFSQTWYPHLWRIKCEPMVNSEEFSQILNAPVNQDTYLGNWDATKTYPAGYVMTFGDKNYVANINVPAGTMPPNPTYWSLDTADNLADILSTYNKNIAINDAALNEARRLLPESGYDNSNLYIAPTYGEFSENGVPSGKYNQPAPPINIITNSGGAPVPMGQVAMMRSAKYKNASPVIRIPKQAVKSIWDMTADMIDSPINVKNTLSLESVTLPKQMIGNGSGPVSGTKVLSVYSMGVISGPYGTADNTYATADQFPTIELTTDTTTPVNTNIITCVPIAGFNDLVPGLLLSATLLSASGYTSPFPVGTYIGAVDKVLYTITLVDINGDIVNTTSSIPAGTAILAASNFTGTVSPEMDFRADCDPAYQYITRSSPRTFGYSAGYMTGGGQAPNGFPTGAGISFPQNPQVGDYFLRIDYFPQILYRWDGQLWIRISSNVRTASGFDIDNQSQKSGFINNDNQTTLTNGTVVPQRQALSSILQVAPDNLPPVA